MTKIYRDAAWGDDTAGEKGRKRWQAQDVEQCLKFNVPLLILYITSSSLLPVSFLLFALSGNELTKLELLKSKERDVKGHRVMLIR